MGLFFTFATLIILFLVISSVHASTIARQDHKVLPINHLIEWSIVDQPPLPFVFGSNSSQGQRSLKNDLFLPPNKYSVSNHSGRIQGAPRIPFFTMEETGIDHAIPMGHFFSQAPEEDENSLGTKTMYRETFEVLMAIFCTLSLISTLMWFLVRSFSGTMNTSASFFSTFSYASKGAEVNRIGNLEMGGVSETPDEAEDSTDIASTSPAKIQLVSIEQPIAESSQITTRLSPSRELENPQLIQSSLTLDTVTDHSNILVSNEPLKWGKTNISLTFQATLALMIFFESSPPSTSSPSNDRSSSINIIGASMVIGFTFSVIGVLLRNACPKASVIGDYIGLLSTTFGFFTMIHILLPKSFSWTVWPAFSFIFFAFVVVVARTK